MTSAFGKNFSRLWGGLAVVLATWYGSTTSAQTTQLPDSWLEKISFRSIGPASMGGRITSLAIYEADPSIYYVGSASGGLLKTVNNGHDFVHQFDREATVSIGDVQVAQTDPNIVWIGTGEANPRNSVSYGDGVYKSTDGGKTWTNVGLRNSFQIGRIAIHPQNPDIVYVGALGRLWGANEERGLFKTTDGGKTWEKILYIDDKTGVIDVQMNPKNPDELLIATYERLRDNTDDNDPIKRYGDGSGIYKTSDGGKTFVKLTAGLPTCKLGRIGLSYYRADPSVILAIVESEKIAKEPEDAAYAGWRSEDAELGARVADVAKDSPAEKAGLKSGDIILEVNGQLVLSNEVLDNAIRSRTAGEKIKIRFAREKQPQEVEVELGKYPQNTRRRNVFDGSLGGQVENRQNQQGPEGFQYGGVYRSTDGGASWTRINSLNPRPMYYSQIRVDPVDKNYVYVLGTSLYRSSDGGETFKGDGGNDGIHVDHHALWINPTNPKHMILGNDGGLHTTYDRMDNWDTHNHFAIGQFYHVGVDTRRDYNVYGGLQDNGSWGGPNRSGRDSGPVNTDWFRVGGGDGFITLVDPNDPDQIYFESQNGGNGRINLRTGERGFIRPRPPRGVTYRFNWKTPFILSPHNSKIYYSAGNYVFRSFNKGDNLTAISDDITNSKKGSASALTESPVQQGVLYVGTTCGAVWVSQDGGQKWEPVFVQKEAESAAPATGTTSSESGSETADSPAAAEGAEAGGNRERGGRGGRGRGSRGGNAAPANTDAGGNSSAAATESAAAETKDNPPATTEKSGESANPGDITGTWKLAAGERMPGLQLKLKWEADQLTGFVVTPRGETAIEDGKFDPATGKFSFAASARMGKMEIQGQLKDGQLTGNLTAGEGRFNVEFQGTKEDPQVSLFGFPYAAPSFTGLSARGALLGLLVAPQDPQTQDPPVVTDEPRGTWNASMESDQLPDGRLEFDIIIEVNAENRVSGKTVSAMGEFAISEGFYNPETKKLTFVAGSEDFTIDFEATIAGDKMKGSVEVAGGQATMEFTASKAGAKPETPATPATPPVTPPPAEPAAKPAEEMPAAKPAETQPAAATPAATEPPAESPRTPQEPAATTPAADDKVSGKWGLEVNMGEGRRGMGDMTLELKLGPENQVTGVVGNQRGDTEISGGKFNPETKAIEWETDNGRFNMAFKGTVADNRITGTVSFGEAFSGEFVATRSGEGAPATTTAAGETKGAEAQAGSLKAQLPGPRWVSALEASRFAAGRCYITLDGHKYNDDEPYVFVTEDFGKTWKSLRGNLPTSAGATLVIREDIKNANVLYLGCEFSAWVSIDRGQSWSKFPGLPTVAVHEFAQHPTSGELIVGTHGRSIWIADVTALRQFAPSAKGPQLYQPNNVVRWRSEPQAGDSGTRRFIGQNPPSNAQIFYSLDESAREIELMITDVKGQVVRKFDSLSTEKGLHRVDWDLRSNATGGQRGAGARGGAGGPGGGGPGGRGGGTARTGAYLVTLKVDGVVLSQSFEIEADPDLPADASPLSMEAWEYEEGD